MIIELIKKKMLDRGYKEYIKNPCGEEIYLGPRITITFEEGGIGYANNERRRNKCHIYFVGDFVRVDYHKAEIGERYTALTKILKHRIVDPDFNIDDLLENVIQWLKTC